MNRLSSKEKVVIISMIKRGRSLNQISRVTGRSKTTIYYHMVRIRGKTNIDKLKIPDDPSILSEFLGAFAGDGSFHKGKNGKYTFIISLSRQFDNEYADYWVEVFKKKFNKDLKKYTYDNVIRLKLLSKRLYQTVDSFLVMKNKTYDVMLKGKINEYSDDFLSSFVRGLMDTDGYVSSRNVIGLSIVSKRMICQVSQILSKLGIENVTRTKEDPRPNCHTLYEVFIKYHNLSIYYQKIGFSNPRKRRMLEKNLRRPGIEPGSEPWQGPIISA